MITFLILQSPEVGQSGAPGVPATLPERPVARDGGTVGENVPTRDQGTVGQTALARCSGLEIVTVVARVR